MSTEHRSAARVARHGIMNGAVLAFAVVTGCAVGPDYRAPERRAVALAHDRYRSGLVDFLDVLETERTLYAAQTELARGQRAVGQDLVRLYKALGGGWSHEAARAQAMQSPWPISSKK